MSISTTVCGLISSDDDLYKKHSKVLLACIEAEIKELPKETALYFNSKYPNEGLLEEKLTVELKTCSFNKENESIIEVIISEIPKGVYKIRFANSY